MPKILTTEEIKNLHDEGQSVLRFEESPLLTDLAKELLERLNMRVLVESKEPIRTKEVFEEGNSLVSSLSTGRSNGKSMKKLLASGRRLCGTFVGIPHPTICETAGSMGFDFLIIDGEHSAMTIETIQSMLMATDLTPACGIVRVPVASYECVAGTLDAGAQGLLIPQIRTPEDVARVRDYSMYPPAGKRGIGPGRASSYGMAIMDRATGDPNADTCIMLQIETSEALENLEAIAGFDFFDLLFLGPGDLSMNLGVFGQFEHPLLLSAIDRVFAVCQRRGKKSGIFAGSMKAAEKWLNYGFDMVVVSSEIGLLAEAAKNGLAALRSLPRRSGEGKTMPEFQAKKRHAGVSYLETTGGNEADLLLAGAQVVIPELGIRRLNVVVKNGKIAALTTERPETRRVIDLSGKYLLPGIIDPHVHLGLFAPLEEELRTESRAALIGGVTGVGCFFNQPSGYHPLLKELARKVPDLSHVDLLPHLTLRDPIHLRELPEYRGLGVRSYKVYFCGIPGILPHQEDGFVLRCMERIAAIAPDALLCIHAENASVVADRTDELMASGVPVTLRNWSETHPEISEEEGVARAVLFATKLGIRLYLVHIGTRTAVEFLSRNRKTDVFVETTSPYLSLHDDPGGADHENAMLKMVPPVRNQATVDFLWEAIQQGLIDTIGTDNTTLTSREKGGGMRNAVPGYPALGTHLPSVLHEGLKRGIPLEKIVKTMTLNPARILGIYPRKGTILPGSDADLVVADLEKEKRVDAAELGGRSDFALHDGEVLRGWPVMTVKNGHVAVENGQLTGVGAAVVRGTLLKA